VGSPIHKAAGRAALIAVMLGGGLLCAGISQAQDAGAQDIQAERGAELVAASGGPASADHLLAFDKDRAAVETRDDDVAALPSASAPALQPQPAAAPLAAPDPAQPRRVASADTPPPPSR
jgi:hypothetical protein